MAADPLTATEQVTTALNSISGLWDRVFHFNRLSGTWEFYNVDPTWVDANTLHSLELGQFYWVNTSSDASLNHAGRTIELFTGWNIVAW